MTQSFEAFWGRILDWPWTCWPTEGCSGKSDWFCSTTVSAFAETLVEVKEGVGATL